MQGSFKPRLEGDVWDPRMEAEIRALWEKENLYAVDPKAERLYTIDTPPPYTSGRPWHIGAVAQYAMIDMIARTGRMLGRPVYFPVGMDRNGIQVEYFVERELGISVGTTPRERFIEACRALLDRLEEEMVDILKKIGFSADFENLYHTDSPDYRSFTQATFIQLWKQGLIYEATRPNSYCPRCTTTLADPDIEYEMKPTDLVYIRFWLPESNAHLTIATTRPELLSSCQAVIVSPGDQRYTHLHGVKVRVPIFGQTVTIWPHPAARPEFGTGAAMICSYGDLTDVQIFRELRLPEAISIDERGRMTERAGPLAGLTVSEARQKAIEELEAVKLVEKVERIMHRTPVHERCSTPIEIIPMKEYYLKQLDFKDEVRRLSQRIRFLPERHRQRLHDWIDSITIDWPISRRRYYGTEIPLWYCANCQETILPPPGPYYRPWAEPPPIERCPRCGGGEFVGEERTFDTWVDSSVSALYIARFGRDPVWFKKTYPSWTRPQGYDIIRTWLYYSILRCYQLTGKAPWRNAWISGMGLDERGEKMSKSRGNVIDPWPIVAKYGADTFRFWAASEANVGEDFRCSEARIAGAKKFLSKLWNVARFISQFPQPQESETPPGVKWLQPADRWILAELSRLTSRCRRGYLELNFYIPATNIREFLWNLFAPHYIEMVKRRAYMEGFSEAEARAAWYTLHTALQQILKLLAPITPFITDRLWRDLYGPRSIHLERLPKPRWPKTYTSKTGKIVEFNSLVWKTKKSRGLPLTAPISIEIPRELKAFSKDLVAMHRIEPIPQTQLK
jgi:valyl-tRNA synthetase